MLNLSISIHENVKNVIRYSLSIFFVAILILVLFFGLRMIHFSESSPTDVFVGVDVAYDDIPKIKETIDEVKSYTNFFVVGSTGITYYLDKLTEVCQYLYDSGLHFATYTHLNISIPQAEWVSNARQKWGDQFVGLYAYDEPGGSQMDKSTWNGTQILVPEADNYTDAANKYVENMKLVLNYFLDNWNIGDFPLITSDYVLYEFDYRAGYDAILAELAWNHSRPINVALCRGAATVRNKNWGAMITYTYDNPPYLASGTQIYNDMVTAYQNGAKYIVVFDYAKDPVTNATHGILQQQHLDALKQFWQYIKDNPRTNDTIENRVAYILPKDYGYGFRGPDDKIWGLWEADELASKIWDDINTLVEQYNYRLDIIYEDTLQFNTFKYSKLIFWNGTTITN